MKGYLVEQAADVFILCYVHLLCWHNSPVLDVTYYAPKNDSTMWKSLVPDTYALLASRRLHKQKYVLVNCYTLSASRSVRTQN